MSESARTFLIQQIGYQSPMFLVLLAAAVMAVMYRKQASAASVLTLIGIAILALTTIGGALSHATFMDAVADDAGDHQKLAKRMMLVGLSAACLRGVGLAFLVSAIFVGRNTADVDQE